MKKSALPMRRLLPALFLCVFSGIPGAVSGDDGDWPVWRFDSAHTASTPHNLPDELHPLWVRQYSPRKPAWDDPLNRDLMPFDRIFEPIVADGTLVVGFNDSDKLVALDTDTGKEKWTFYTDGPVRLPGSSAGGRPTAACSVTAASSPCGPRGAALRSRTASYISPRASGRSWGYSSTPSTRKPAGSSG